MTGSVYAAPAAVIVLLLREHNGKKQVLCQKRKNTGFADGMFDFSFAGKLEEGETFTIAAAREAKEELGIVVNPADLKFMALVHKRDAAFGLVFYNAYFICEKHDGTPKICEPNKCDNLSWFSLDDLPDNLIDDRKQALKAYLDGESYLEYGWEPCK